MKSILLFAIGTTLSLSAVAQVTTQATTVVEPLGTRSVFRIIVTNRTVQAINYRHRSGASDVDFAGTALMLAAEGKAKVRSKRGTLEVEADFGGCRARRPLGANI